MPGKEFNEILTDLETWYLTDRGRYTLDLLTRAIEGELDTAFGYHLAQVGATRCHPLYNSSTVRHRVYVAARRGEAVNLVAEADELPLASDSVDVVIAHHSLEFARNPHQVLRELHRILTPQGHLYIIGFNPWSLHGAGLALRSRARSALWGRRHPLSTWRLTDWLNVLGLEQESVSQLYAVPLWGGRRLRPFIERCNRWCERHRLPIGGVYLVHAVKQVPGNIRPAQRARRGRLIDLAVPQAVPAPRPAPTPRSGDHAA